MYNNQVSMIFQGHKRIYYSQYVQFCIVILSIKRIESLKINVAKLKNNQILYIRKTYMSKYYFIPNTLVNSYKCKIKTFGLLRIYCIT